MVKHVCRCKKVSNSWSHNLLSACDRTNQGSPKASSEELLEKLTIEPYFSAIFDGFDFTANYLEMNKII